MEYYSKITEPWTMSCKEWEVSNNGIFGLGRRIGDRISQKEGSVLKPTKKEIVDAADFWDVTQRDARVALDYYNYGHTYMKAPRIDWKKYHTAIVKKAILQGKVVPDKVLKEYPDLVKAMTAPSPIRRRRPPSKTSMLKCISNEIGRKLPSDPDKLRQAFYGAIDECIGDAE